MQYIGIADRYQIIDLIGKGGMGEVFRVSDRFDSYSVKALKIISRDIKIPNTRLLKNEFLLLSMLSHPNLIKVYDLGFYQREMEYIYYTMEYVDQQNLDNALPDLGMVQKLEIVKLILQALLYVHSRGILHLDLKPKNILIPGIQKGEKLKIIDFGLSELKINSQNMNTSKGSLAFIAPEVLARERNIDERADLFSLGALILRIYSGRMFRLYALKDHEVKKLLCRYIPPKMVKFVEKLLYINRNSRFRNSSEAFDYLVDLMNLTPYVLNKDDYIDILSKNPQYGLDEKMSNTAQAIETGRAKRIQVYGIRGTGKTRFLRELELRLRMKNCKTFFIGRRMAGSYKYSLTQELSIQGILNDAERKALEDDISGLVKDRSSSEMTDIKKVIAYKLADFLKNRLNDAVLLVDDLKLIHKHERDIIRIMLPVPGLYMAAVIVENRPRPARGYDAEVHMSNFSQEDTAKFVSLCLGLRDINPRSISDIALYSGGNPRKIKDYLLASLSLGTTNTPEGLILSLPPEISADGSAGIEKSLLDIKLNRLSGEDFNLLFILGTFPRPMNIMEIQNISGLKKDEAEDSLQRLVRSGLLELMMGSYTSSCSLPEDFAKKHIGPETAQKMICAMAELIIRNPRDCNPYRILFIFRSAGRFHDGYAEILKTVLKLYKSGNPYNALEVLNYLIKEYRDIRSEYPEVSFDMSSPTRYFEIPRPFSLLNLKLLKSELLRMTGRYKDSSRLYQRLLKTLDKGDAFYHIKYSIAGNHAHLHEFEDALDVLDSIMDSIGDISSHYYFQSLSQKCWIYLQTGRAEECSQLLDRHYKSVDDMPVTIKMVKAAIYYGSSKYSMAIDLLTAVSSQEGSHVDKNTLSKVYNNLGILHKLRSNFEESREYFKKSYELKKEMGDYESLPKTYNNIGSIYLAQHDMETAYSYFKKALASAEMIGDRASIMSASVNISNLYIIFGDPYQAINQLNRILPSALKDKDNEILFYIYSNALEAMVQQKKIERAYYYLNLLAEITALSKKPLFDFHYKLEELYLSIITLDEAGSDKILEELGRDESLKRLSTAFNKHTTLLLDITVLKSLLSKDAKKRAIAMLESYLLSFSKSNIIDNSIIKYGLCLLLLTGKATGISAEASSKKDNYLKKNTDLYRSLCSFYSAPVEKGVQEPFLLFHKTARPVEFQKERISQGIRFTLAKFNELHHIYVEVMPFILCNLLEFCRDNRMNEEAGLLKEKLEKTIEERQKGLPVKKRDMLAESPLVNFLNKI